MAQSRNQHGRRRQRVLAESQEAGKHIQPYTANCSSFYRQQDLAVGLSFSLFAYEYITRVPMLGEPEVGKRCPGSGVAGICEGPDLGAVN